jgi:hypothetical protein
MNSQSGKKARRAAEEEEHGVRHSSSLTLGGSRAPHYIYWCNSLQTSKVGLNFGATPC